MKVGFRTIKTALGVSLSILLAQSFGLQYYTASGILTLLCIQRSRKQSFKAAGSRLAACLASLFFSTLLFELIGYGPYAFFILLLLFIPFCVRFGIQEGIASSSVIVMHVYMHKKAEFIFFVNELSVILIGLGVALLVNWYMPSIDKEIARCREELDRLLDTILSEVALYMKEGSTMWNGQELLRLPEVLERGRRLAAWDAENHPRRKRSSFAHYLELKRKQYEILERMLPSISRITIKLEQGGRIGDFIADLNRFMKRQAVEGLPGGGAATGVLEEQEEQEGDGLVRRSNTVTAAHFYERLRWIREYHRHLPLPETRDEFENRACLYTVANELERFISTVE